MKKLIRILSLSLVLLMTVASFASCSEKDKDGGAVDADAVFNDMPLEEVLAAVMKDVEIGFDTAADLLTEENFEYVAFVPYAEGYEAITGDAFVNAIPHSLVIVRVPDGSDVAAVAADIEANANPRKWVCVEAEKVAVKTRGRVILLAMSTNDIVDGLVANFESYMPAAESDAE